MWINYLLIGIFGAFGACLRAWICGFHQSSWFPWGTSLVNILGCFFLGFLSGASDAFLPEQLKKPIATGFLGSLTTFSTFSVETLTLLEKQGPLSAFLYFAPQLVLGLGLAFLGIILGRSLG